MSPHVISTSAPSRIDLAGGTLDIWPISVLVPDAVTVNLALELRATVTVTARDDRRVTIISRDRRRRSSRRLPLPEAPAPGPLSLLWRIVTSFDPPEGICVESEALAPAGAGLGGSSTLAIAAAAAMNRYTGAGLGRSALLRRVMNLEAAEIRVPTGNQDYLAALNGGLSAYHHEVDGTRREKLEIPEGLEERLVLAYTGEPRQSGFSNWEMFRRYVEGDRRATERMQEIGRIARELLVALRDGDLDRTGRLIGEEGRLRYGLASSVATPALKRADGAARRAGALGVKVCGAGGGGCLVAFAGKGRREAVARAIASTGARLLDARISRQGARVRQSIERRPGS
jgi:D-glycero-alpha-D-manno-heptose-7-phosphate kinase